MSLSDRVRPDCEAAPWVIEEIRKLEADLEKAREEERRETINGIIGYCHEAGHYDVKNSLEEYLEKLDVIAEGGEG